MLDNMPGKKEVLDACMKLTGERIQFLKNCITELTTGGEADAKSSAGDKHETARAMLQAEQEKFSLQLKEAMVQLEVLEQIKPDIKHTQVALGSLVKTNRTVLFLSVAIGKIKVSEVEIIALSPASPLGAKLIGLDAGGEVSVNAVSYVVLEID